MQKQNDKFSQWQYLAKSDRLLSTVQLIVSNGYLAARDTQLSETAIKWAAMIDQLCGQSCLAEKFYCTDNLVEVMPHNLTRSSLLA